MFAWFYVFAVPVHGSFLHMDFSCVQLVGHSVNHDVQHPPLRWAEAMISLRLSSTNMIRRLTFTAMASFWSRLFRLLPWLHASCLNCSICNMWLCKCSLGFMCLLCLCVDLSCTWIFPVCSLLLCKAFCCGWICHSFPLGWPMPN